MTAADGRAALEQVGTERPDAIRLDVMMPDLDGFEVCRRLRTAGDRKPGGVPYRHFPCGTVP